MDLLNEIYKQLPIAVHRKNTPPEVKYNKLNILIDNYRKSLHLPYPLKKLPLGFRIAKLN